MNFKSGFKDDEVSVSENKSRKSSSSFNDYNDYKMDKFERRSSSGSAKGKKRRRSNSRDQEKRQISKSPNRNFQREKSSSKSPKMRNKVTSMISEKNSSKIFVPGFDGPLVSLSLFNELQHNILPTETIESAYKDYKSKYEQKRFQSFYVEHKDDEWFKEKYDQEMNLRWKSERNSQCQKLCQKFNDALIKGHFSGLKLELRESDENNRNVKIMTYGYNREKNEFDEKERDVSLLMPKAGEKSFSDSDFSGSPYFAFDPDNLTLFLHQIPRNVSRWQILEVLKKLPGFIFMSLSEPIKNQNYYRYCWVTFDTEENCDLAYESLNDYRISNDYKISPIKSRSSTLKKIRMTPALYQERNDEDLEFSKTLISMFDKEKGIENSLIEKTENRNKDFQLDLQVLYLRRVHGFCYYCLEEFEDERALSTKCDNVHVRNYKYFGSRECEKDLNNYEYEWDKNFTRLVKAKIEKGVESNKNTSIVNEELNKKRNDYCKEHTSSVSAERYVCNICNKMFKGANFVHNHIFNKHMNLIQDSVDKDFYENLKYENYVADPSRIYEKYKIISSMDDYLYYLNTIKSSGGQPVNNQYDNRRPPTGGKYFKDFNRGRDDRRKPRREFKDYDNPNDSSQQNQAGGRQLISYDDL